MNRLVVTTSLIWSLIPRCSIAYDGKSQRGVILLNETVYDLDNDNLSVSGSLVERLGSALEKEVKQLQEVAGEAVKAVVEMADGGAVGQEIRSGKTVANSTMTNRNRGRSSNTFGSLYRSGNVDASAGSDDEECRVETFDVFLVQDTSQTFQSDLNAAVTLMEDWILSIQDEYEGSRFGYGTFTDKPIPLSGFGPYGGWQNVKMQYDWCFEMEQRLVDDKDIFVSSLKKVWKKKGSGFDLLESQFEALLRAAMSVDAGWDDERPNVNPNTHVRVVILITDASSHLNGDAADNIAKYNLPIVLADPATLRTDGGWGSHAFSGTDMVNYMKEKSYNKLADLIAKETFGTGILTEKEETEMNKQAEYFKPSVYPSVVPHPGDDSLSCSETEYPSPEQVAGVLTGRAIVPVILVINGDSPDLNKCAGQGGKDLRALQACPLMFYKEWMQMYGIRGLVRGFTNDSEHTLSAMIQGVLDSAAVICEDPILSTMPPPTRPPSTPAPELPPVDTTPAAVTPSPTKLPSASTPDTISTPAPEPTPVPTLDAVSTPTPELTPVPTPDAISTPAWEPTPVPTFPGESEVASLPTPFVTEGTRLPQDTELPPPATESTPIAPETVPSTDPVVTDPIVEPTEATIDPTTQAASESASESSEMEPELEPTPTESTSTPSAEFPEDSTPAFPGVPSEIPSLGSELTSPSAEVEPSETGPTRYPAASSPAEVESTPKESEVTSEPLLVTTEEDVASMSEQEVTEAAEESDDTTAVSTSEPAEPSLDVPTVSTVNEVSGVVTEAHSSFLQKTTLMPATSSSTETASQHASGTKMVSGETVYTDMDETPSPIYSDFETTPESETAQDERVTTESLDEESTTGASNNKKVVAIASAVGGAGALGAAALLAHTTGLVGSGGAGAVANAAVETAPEAAAANRESVQFVSQDMFA